MRTILALLLAALFSARTAPAGEAPKAKSVDEVIAGLFPKEGPPRKAEELEADYQFVVSELVKGLAGDDMSKWRGADTSLEALCHQASAPGREAHRLAAAKALVANIRAAGLTPLGSERVVRHLERIGAAEAVPALGELLGDKALREPARRALAANRAPEATKALLAALPRAEKEFRVALIAALGFRRDPAALKPLLALAGDADDDVRTYAAESLAILGDGSAADAIAAAMGKGSAHAQVRATNACLLLADALAAKGEREAALRLFRPLLGAKSYAKCAALIGVGKAGSAKDVETLVASVITPNHAERGAAIQGLIFLPDKAATAAIAGKARGAEPALKAALIGVLGKRGDPAAVPAVLDAAKDSEEAVRTAAWQALGDLKAEHGVAPLVAALGTAKDAERDMAEWALARIPGKGATKAIVAALDGAAPEAKCALLRSLGYREDAETLLALLAATKDAAEEVRAAAFMAIGQLNQVKAVPAILDALAKSEGKVKEAAVYALRRTQGPDANAAIVEAAKSAAPGALAPLLEVLSWREDPAVKGLLVASARHADPAVRTAAIEGLARARDPGVVPIIIEAAMKGEGALRDAAVRTALQYTDDIVKADKAAALTIYSAALDRKVVPNHGDRRLAIRSLGAIGDPAAVQALCSTFRDRQVAGDAMGAVEAIANRLVAAKDTERAIAVYTTFARLCNDPGRLRRAQGELRKLGVEGDTSASLSAGLARRAGFVTRWLAAGPFPNKDNELMGKELPPEKAGVDPLLPVEAMGVAREWKQAIVADTAGILDLAEMFNKEASNGALLYAEVSAPKAGDALLKLAYEEGCVAYVNGKRVHSRAGARLDRLDDQQVKVPLQAGVNKVLLKLVHLDRGLRLAARLTGPNDEAVEFTQAEK